MDDAVVKPIKDLVKMEVSPIREELVEIREQVAQNTVQLVEHSEKLDALSAEMIEVRRTTDSTYDLLLLVADKVGIDIPSKKK